MTLPRHNTDHHARAARSNARENPLTLSSSPTCARLDPLGYRRRPAHLFPGPQKIRNRYNAAPAQSQTLEQLVENEKGEKKRTATEGLLWLLRCVGGASLGLRQAAPCQRGLHMIAGALAG